MVMGVRRLPQVLTRMKAGCNMSGVVNEWRSGNAKMSVHLSRLPGVVPGRAVFWILLYIESTLIPATRMRKRVRV